MQHPQTKSERQLVRRLADIAWKRQLHEALKRIGTVISEMESGKLSPFDANEAVHQFHNGISRKLYNLYSASDPWLAVCRAHYDGVLTDADLADASENVRTGLKQFADSFRSFNGIQTAHSPRNDG